MSESQVVEEPLPPAALDDPHLQPYAKHPGRAQAVAAITMLVGIVGIVGWGIAYWQAASTEVQGFTLGVGLFGLGFGLTAWGKYLMPQGPFVEQRHPMPSSVPEREAFSAALTERGGIVVKRRRMLGGIFAAGSGIFGIVALFPVIRSMGPRPGQSTGGPASADSLQVTDWKKGSLLVSAEGTPVHVTDLEVGGSLTVFPEGFVGQAPDQVILIRPAEYPADYAYPIVTRPGRETWSPQGYLAYSKLCTHAGCPVGLYLEQTQQLLCPCHQSIFDVLSGATQVFGPAPRPLPQLPLEVDGNGYLRSQSGFDQPVGPGFWERA